MATENHLSGARPTLTPSDDGVETSWRIFIPWDAEDWQIEDLLTGAGFNHPTAIASVKEQFAEAKKAHDASTDA